MGLRGSGIQGSEKGVTPPYPAPKKSFSHCPIKGDGLCEVSSPAKAGQNHPCEIVAPGPHLRTNCGAARQEGGTHPIQPGPDTARAQYAGA